MREEWPRGTSRSVDRGARRPAIEPRNSLFLGADAVIRAEGNTEGRAIASARTGPAWSETLACTYAPCTGTGRSPAWPRGCIAWSASGRRGALADDARAGEARPLHSSEEVGEQSRATGSGAGGAKGGDRGKRRPVTHVPGTESGKRVIGAGLRATSRKDTRLVAKYTR